jgi:hypothetical protein
MRNHKVPDDGLERFGVRRHRLSGHGWDDDASVGDLGREAAVSAHYTDDLRALFLGESQGFDEVGADVFFDVATAD